jgi:hypothetical protein
MDFGEGDGGLTAKDNKIVHLQLVVVDVGIDDVVQDKF